MKSSFPIAYGTPSYHEATLVEVVVHFAGTAEVSAESDKTFP